MIQKTPYARSKLEDRLLDVTKNQMQLAHIVGHTLGELLAEHERLISEHQRLKADLRKLETDNTALKDILTSNKWFATV